MNFETFPKQLTTELAIHFIFISQCTRYKEPCPSLPQSTHHNVILFFVQKLFNKVQPMNQNSTHLQSDQNPPLFPRKINSFHFKESPRGMTSTQNLNQTRSVSPDLLILVLHQTHTNIQYPVSSCFSAYFFAKTTQRVQR